MALFNLGRKREAEAPQAHLDINEIRVLGTGCCHELYENAQAAARALGLNVDVEYITDMEQVMAYGAMSMPALVVNGRVVSMGRVLKPADVERLLKKLSA